VRLSDGRVVHSSGAGVIFADMISAIVHDGPRVIAVAFLGVVVLLVVFAGWRRDTLWVTGALVMGVVLMVGAAAAVNVRLNFLNFIALPITFGIGVDYGINLVERYRQEGAGGIGKTIVATGGAVALCSLTTIIGYAALLLADSHALRSFGGIAILGEIACGAVALTVLPAYLAVSESRRGRKARKDDIPP
jgi:predicted RND superfamily exporter protein